MFVWRAMTSAEVFSVRSRRGEIAFGLFLFVLAFAYVFAVKHIWEDYFITFRHSKNFAEGRGLVYHEGERIHGFTSPIGVLLPALFHVIAGKPESYFPALLMFQVVGALAFAGAGVLLLRLLRTAVPDELLLPWAGAILYAVEFKSLAFSMNGQETGLMLFFLAWMLRSLQLGVDVHWKALGVAWAGLQWTRPDGCVFVVATALATLLFSGGRSRIGLFVAFLKAGVLSLILYAPWLIATTIYYGTPIPHTVSAKAGAVPMVRNLFGPFPFGLADRIRDRAGSIFEPIYAVFGGWPETLVRFVRGVGLVGLVWWMIPIRGPFARFSRWTGFAAFLTVLYLTLILIFPWYLPPIALLMILSLAAGAFSAPRTFLVVVVASWLFVEMWDKNYFARMEDGRFPFKPREAWILLAAVVSALVLPTFLGAARRAPRTAMLAVIGVAGMLGAVSVCSWREIAVQQEYVENRHRRVIGEWLRENAKPGETIYLESLGYIGYFSNGTMLDWPGLVAPRVIAERRRAQGRLDMIQAASVLVPDWLVFRRKSELLKKEYWREERANSEFERAKADPWIMLNYEIIREFNDAEAIWRNFPNLPGLGYLLNDADHVVMRRKGIR
jgi:hypothetical protein